MATVVIFMFIMIGTTTITNLNYFCWWVSLARPQEPYQVRKGDSFKTTCFYDSEFGTSFGLESDQEMCSAFILYFPKQDFDFCGVGLGPLDENCTAKYLGRESLNSASELGRVFGKNEINAPTPTTTKSPFLTSSSPTTVSGAGRIPIFSFLIIFVMHVGLFCCW